MQSSDQRISGDSANIKFSNIFEPIDTTQRRTKIVCTLGPACKSVEKLCEMIYAGMNIARFNFSHGDHKSHGEFVTLLDEALKQRPGHTVAKMLDTKGPEIRTGMLKDHKPIELKINQELEITTDYTFEGDNTKIACSYKALPTSVKVDSTIFIADGSLTCRVTKILEVSSRILFSARALFTGLDVKKYYKQETSSRLSRRFLTSRLLMYHCCVERSDGSRDE